MFFCVGSLVTKQDSQLNSSNSITFWKNMGAETIRWLLDKSSTAWAEYHQLLQLPSEEDSPAYWRSLGRYITNTELAERYKESIVYTLHAEKRWPDREFMAEDKSHGSSGSNRQRNSRNAQTAIP